MNMKKKALTSFAAAWSTRDIPAIVEFFAEDCSYSPSLYHGDKHSFQGKHEIKKEIARIIAFDNTTSSEVFNIHVRGAFGFWEWNYNTPSGKIKGCDVFTFRDNKILTKNAFRKINLECS